MMPQFDITVIKAEEIWSKGDLSIYALTLDYEGQEMTAKTFSKQIAKAGWAGTVETYEKDEDTFVRQPKKEYSPNKGSGRPQADPFTMYMSYAKDVLVARVEAGLVKKTESYSDMLDEVVAGAYILYEGRPGGVGVPDKPQGKKTYKMDDIEIEDVDDAVEETFGKSEKLKEDDPWTKNKPQLPT